MPVLHVFHVQLDGQYNFVVKMQSNLCVVVLYKSQHLRFICTMKRVYGEQKLYKWRQKKAYIFKCQ